MAKRGVEGKDLKAEGVRMPWTVLIADDETTQRFLMSAALDGLPCQILEAADGLEALIVATREKPDVLLLDVKMPGLDGYEVCRRLKIDQATQGIEVIMLTCETRSAEVMEGLRAGADHYLTKPFSPLELLRLVKQRLALDG